MILLGIYCQIRRKTIEYIEKTDTLWLYATEGNIKVVEANTCLNMSFNCLDFPQQQQPKKKKRRRQEKTRLGARRETYKHSGGNVLLLWKL